MRPIIPYLRFSTAAQEPRSHEWLEQRRRRLLAEVRLIESLQRNWKRHPKRSGLIFTAKDQEEMFLEHAYATLLRFRNENTMNGAGRVSVRQ